MLNISNTQVKKGDLLGISFESDSEQVLGSRICNSTVGKLYDAPFADVRSDETITARQAVTTGNMRTRDNACVEYAYNVGVIASK